MYKFQCTTHQDHATCIGIGIDIACTDSAHHTQIMIQYTLKLACYVKKLTLIYKTWHATRQTWYDIHKLRMVYMHCLH